MSAWSSAAALVCFLLLPDALRGGGSGACIRPQEDETAAIESRLLQRLNEERASIGLGTLVLSPALTLASRAHSRDMTERSGLSHISSDGRTLADRLAEAGVYFSRCGENIAFSETSVADIIHQELMASPEHRSQILEPELDTAGLGVVRVPGGRFYITQDFIQALVPVPAFEAEAVLRRKVETAREERALPALCFLEDMTPLARSFGLLRAEKKPPPRFPERYGGISAYIVTSSSLESAGIVSGPLLETKYVGVGVGVHFGRNAEHPGGAYVMVFLLIKGREAERNTAVGERRFQGGIDVHGSLQAAAFTLNGKPVPLETDGAGTGSPGGAPELDRGFGTKVY